MTDLLTRPVSRPSRDDVRERPRMAAAALAAAAAAGAGLLVVAVIVVLSWAAAPAGTNADDAVRAIGQIWLLGHRVGLAVPGGHVALLPLGLLLLPAYTLFRAGEWYAVSTRVHDIRAAAAGGLAIGGFYGLITAIVGALSVSTAIRPSGGQALVAGLCAGSVFGTVGALRGSQLMGTAWEQIPLRGRAVLGGAGRALVSVLAAGLVLVVGGVLLHAGRVSELGSSLHPGVLGTFALLLASLVYVPTAVVWGAAYAVGPGFAVGAGTGVSPLGVRLGDVPSFPLLGALPGDGSAPLLALPALLVPLLGGVWAGVAVIRRLPALTLEEAAFWGFATGAVAGTFLGVLAAIASGPAGPGRLATVGPSGWQVALCATLEFGLTASLAAAETQRRLMRR